MHKSFLKISLRNLHKHKVYSLVNIASLSVGVTSCILIFLFVHNELSYDRFHKNRERIYRLVNDVRLPTGITKTGYVSAFAGPDMLEAIPEIETMVRLANPRASFVFEHNGQHFEERELLFADSTLFAVFDFPLIYGDPRSALKQPFSLVLTRTAAKKYFGDTNPVGQTLIAGGENAFTVTGVLADIPAASHLRFDGLVSMATALQMQTFHFEDLLDLRFATYFLLREGAQKSDLEAKFVSFVEQKMGDIQRRNNFFYTFGLVPLTDVYFHEAHRGLGAKGSPSDVYIFSAIALFTLLIACINFMNLTTARSAIRAREVGVRKTVGAIHRQLIAQFLQESVLLSFLALAAALFFASQLLPFFNTLAGKTLTMSIFLEPRYLLGIALLGLVLGLMAGSYPAFVLARFKPVSVLRGRFLASNQGVTLRQALVVSQFALSVILIIGSGIVYRQLLYMQDKDLGFNTEQMLVLDFKSDKKVLQQLPSIKEEMLRIPGVDGVTASWIVPGFGKPVALAGAEVADGGTRELMIPVYPVDFDFLSVFDFEIVAGRGFSPDFATDHSQAFVVNETAVAELGYTSPGEIIGKAFSEWGREGRVIGVVKDFHYTSLRDEITPMNFLIGTDLARYLTLRISGGGIRYTIAQVEETWQRLAPHRPFDTRFLDEAFNTQYLSEERFGKIVGTSSVLATFIACLGLFGLAAFAAEQRTKEIGVRKILGASVKSIILLLSKDLTKLVLLAAVIAFPVAWLAIDLWLQGFAYRISISWWIFAGSMILALGVALLTVSSQAIRVATANPVDTLRHE